MIMMNTKISVIVPVYNEIKNLQTFVQRLSDVLSKTKLPFEVLLVDDNSTDGSYEYIRSLNKKGFKAIRKDGKQGKAFSLYQGLQASKGDIIITIDADLQYAPEEIPAMITKLNTSDVVVANRQKYCESKIRKLSSRVFRAVFGKGLFNLDVDIQSGLKAFKKEVFDTVGTLPKSGWTFDLEFLHRASQGGFLISGHDIEFLPRLNDASKIRIVRSSLEIGTNALRLKTSRFQPFPTGPMKKSSMIGAGVRHNKRKYITHTTLPYTVSAIRTFERNQKILFAAILLVALTGLVVNPIATGVAVLAVISLAYFTDTLFNLYIVMKSLHFSQEISSTNDELNTVTDNELPVYTILCPLYKESHIIPHFLDAIDKLMYPKNKLDVLLLLEEDDVESIDAVNKMNLPSYVRTIVVPESQPKTKPKACNYGLAFAKGEFLVIYDAEDIPDPLQLKKAYLAFKKVPKNVICLQAKLNYFNPHQNLLTRMFTAEYSLWFDVSLIGLQSVQTALPLGGTSNHFRTKDLKGLQGWDPFNVTEDADLGIRLFRKGYRTAIIDSTTLEEANSNVKNWLRQRSRWIKGYMQTYLVHLRDYRAFRGKHAFFFHLILGGKIAFILINPFLWITTISYFALYPFVGETIESLFPSWVFYMAATSLVFGNFLVIMYYMIGCLKRGHYSLIKYLYFVPLYWLLISTAGFVAFYQLLLKPHYWEKTIHGLHLQPQKKAVIAVSGKPQRNKLALPVSLNPITFIAQFMGNKDRKKGLVSGGSLVVAAVLGNILNLVFNTYLGRTIDLSYYSLVSLINSFIYFLVIPFGSLNSSVNFRTAFLGGRYGVHAANLFWRKTRMTAFKLSLILITVWIASVPFLAKFFNTPSVIPYFVFAPLLITSFLAAVDKGFLSGKHLFGTLAVLTGLDPLLKFIFAFTLVNLNREDLIYASIPTATFMTFFVGWFFARRVAKQDTKPVLSSASMYFPKKFYAASFISGLSTMTFLSLDIMLATHFLPAREAGIYALISLVGKMVYFMSGLSSQFILPIVSRKEGLKENTSRTLHYILGATIGLTSTAFIGFGVLGIYTLPIIFGGRAEEILPYTLLFSFAMLCFSVSRVFVTYYLVKKIYSFSVAAFSLAIFQVVLMELRHASIADIVSAMVIVGISNLVLMVLFHLNIKYVKVWEHKVSGLLNIFENASFLSFRNKPVKKTVADSIARKGGAL